MDKNASDGKQKGLGNKPSPNYYQATVGKVLHRTKQFAAKQKGVGMKPTPNYYQTSVN